MKSGQIPVGTAHASATPATVLLPGVEQARDSRALPLPTIHDILTETASFLLAMSVFVCSAVYRVEKCGRQRCQFV
jgi:hypothetical protein